MSDNITIEEIAIELELTVSETSIMVSEVGGTSISIIEEPINLEVLQDLVHEICIEETTTEVLELNIGTQGPKGDPGISGTTTQGIAGEVISALKIVRSINATTVVLADSTINFEEARTLGMSTTAGGIGATIDVVFFGAIEDPSFTYPVNDPLFLTQNGNISNVQDPLSVYNSTIGYSLGAGAIFINLQEPIEL